MSIVIPPHRLVRKEAAPDLLCVNKDEFAHSFW
jgi:hypothetical protein